MKVREAELGDAVDVARLLEGLGHPVDVELVRQRIVHFGDSDRETVLVAMSTEGLLVGVLAMTLSPRFAGEGSFARIIALAVDPPAHRSGIGRTLVNEAEMRARQAGCVVMQVSSGRRPERRAAHEFYPVLGFHNANDHHVLYEKHLVT